MNYIQCRPKLFLSKHCIIVIFLNVLLAYNTILSQSKPQLFRLHSCEAKLKNGSLYLYLIIHSIYVYSFRLHICFMSMFTKYDVYFRSMTMLGTFYLNKYDVTCFSTMTFAKLQFSSPHNLITFF